jgi:hypothetical protein
MNTTPADRSALGLALIAVLILILAACSGGAAPGGATPGSSPPSSPTARPSEQPSPTDPDTGVVNPSDPGLGGGGIGGGDKPVVPRPGTIDPHPVAVERVEPSIDGRHVTVKLTWTSGVEPCYVLDSVEVARDGNAIVLTVLEGSGQQDAICIEIAQTKSTIVDLGELEPGDYTIEVTNSHIPPITITVS